MKMGITYRNSPVLSLVTVVWSGPWCAPSVIQLLASPIVLQTNVALSRWNAAKGVICFVYIERQSGSNSQRKGWRKSFPYDWGEVLPQNAMSVWQTPVRDIASGRSAEFIPVSKFWLCFSVVDMRWGAIAIRHLRNGLRYQMRRYWNWFQLEYQTSVFINYGERSST